MTDKTEKLSQGLLNAFKKASETKGKDYNFENASNRMQARAGIADCLVALGDVVETETLQTISAGLLSTFNDAEKWSNETDLSYPQITAMLKAQVKLAESLTAVEEAIVGREAPQPAKARLTLGPKKSGLH